MPTIDELGKEYAQYIQLNRNNPSVVSEIVSRIEGLTYTESDKHISSVDIKELLNVIEEELTNKRDGKRRRIVEAEDSRELVKLVTMIRNKLKREHK